MKILAIDTSTKYLSLALSQEGETVSTKNVKLEGVLSAKIIPIIDQFLKNKKCTIKKIDGFAVGLGPGSFTSLRVGLSTIKAFAYATGKPVVGICSLDAIAKSVKEAKEICVVSDAKRKLLYTAFYSKSNGALKQRQKYKLLSVDEVLEAIRKGTVFVGDGVDLYREDITKFMAKKNSSQKDIFEKETNWRPQAKYIAELSFERFKKKQYDNIDQLVPMYLYPQDCQVRK